MDTCKVLTCVVFPCSRAAKLLVIERLLQLAETYVTTVEDQYTNPRTIQPHGASFQGPPITMHITSESPKNEFVVVVSISSDSTDKKANNSSV